MGDSVEMYAVARIIRGNQVKLIPSCSSLEMSMFPLAGTQYGPRFYVLELVKQM